MPILFVGKLLLRISMAELIMAAHFFFIISHSDVEIPLWHDSAEEDTRIMTSVNKDEMQAGYVNGQFENFDFSNYFRSDNPEWLNLKAKHFPEDGFPSRPLR